MNLSRILYLCSVIAVALLQGRADDKLGGVPTRRIPAFPGAEGFGMFTTGGRGGDVYEVTTLADSGPGSLREGVSGPNRTVVFRVSGTIELKSTLMLNEPNLTIAGQTAPGAGICLKNYALRINAPNIIVRYLRVRPGDQGRDRQVDGISMGPRGGSDLMFDHCSVSWGIDENFSIYGLPRVTVQWCIISEGLLQANHPKTSHSMGGILSGYDMSMHHNAFISNNDRNPKFNLADWWPGQNTDFRNNLIYNWGARATWGGNGGCTLTNVVNNYYKAGPSSRDRRQFLTMGGGIAGEWFVAGNVVEGAEAISNNNWAGVGNGSTLAAVNAIRVDRAFPAAPVATQSAEDAYRAIVRSAGASFPIRDAVDARVVNDVVKGTGKIVNSPMDVGGWPVLESSDVPADSDHDGMPDAWEVAKHLDPTNPSDRNGLDADGYTNLELFLNSLVPVSPAVNPLVKPAGAFWPSPADGATGEDGSPALRWKAGFAARFERVYFGETEELTEADLKGEMACFRRYVDKQEQASSAFEPGSLKMGQTYYWRIDGVNEDGVTTGQTWSFTTGLPVQGPQEGRGRIEAENMTRSRAFIEDNGTASGQRVTAVATGKGSLRFAFSGPVGTYQLALCYYDERDGAAQISVSVNGRQLDTWKADDNGERYVTHTISDVYLTPGDVIKIVGSRHRDELCRVDYLDVTRTDGT